MNIIIMSELKTFKQNNPIDSIVIFYIYFIDQTIYLYSGDTRQQQITQGPYERKSDVIVKEKEGVRISNA